MAATVSHLALLSTPALPSRRCCRCSSVAAPPLTAARRPRRRASRLLVAAGRRLSEADLYQAVSPATQHPPPPGAAGQPWYVTAPLAFLGVIAALRVAKALKKRMTKDSKLAERGFKKGGVADDKAYTSAIQGMRKVQYDELSEEQILAARRRRQREVEKDFAPLDLDSIELPDNHPFAVKKRLAPEEEALQRSRLSARRGLSEEDMRRLREQQALADQMDAEEEARQAARRRQNGL